MYGLHCKPSAVHFGSPSASSSVGAPPASVILRAHWNPPVGLAVVVGGIEQGVKSPRSGRFFTTIERDVVVCGRAMVRSIRSMVSIGVTGGGEVVTVSPERAVPEP